MNFGKRFCCVFFQYEFVYKFSNNKSSCDLKDKCMPFKVDLEG